MKLIHYFPGSHRLALVRVSTKCVVQQHLIVRESFSMGCYFLLLLKALSEISTTRKLEAMTLPVVKRKLNSTHKSNISPTSCGRKLQRLDVFRPGWTARIVFTPLSTTKRKGAKALLKSSKRMLGICVSFLSNVFILYRK